MCVCARRQPSPTAASPGSPWSPVRVPLCSAASSTCLPPNIVHTVDYYLRTLSIEESLYSAPKSGLDRLLGCD